MGLALLFPLVPAPALAQAGTGPSVSRLPSGQQVIVQENHQQPIVTIDTWVRTGSVNETPGNNGVSHFLEHLLFKGTAKHPTGQLDQLLEGRGAQSNAATSDDFTHYHITLPSSFFEEALQLHADMLMGATIAPDALQRERAVVQEEINRADDNPQRRLFIELIARLFPGHGYALDTLGPKTNIAHIPRADICGYYRHWYQPKNLTTVVVGHVQAHQTMHAIERAFRSAAAAAPSVSDDASRTQACAPQAKYQAPVVTPPQTLASTQPVAVAMPDARVSQVQWVLGFRAPSLAQRKASLALNVAMAVLGQGRSARLVRQLRDDRALVSGVSAGSQAMKYGGLAYIGLDLPPEKVAAARPALLQELNRLLQEGITAEELAKIKTQTVRSFLFENESTQDVAEGLGYYASLSQVSDYTRYVADVQALTVSDVNEALRRYIQPKAAVWLALVPASSGKPNVLVPAEESKTMQAALAQLGQASSPEAQNPTATTAADVGRPTRPAPEASLAAVKKVRLPQGTVLLMKPNAGAQTVAIQAFFRGGEAVEPKPGVAALAMAMLTRGTTVRPASALHEELESAGLTLGATSNEDVLQVSAASAAQDLGHLLLVLQDVLAHPRWDAAEFARQKSLLKENLTAALDQPANLAADKLQGSLYGSHPYGHNAQRVLASLPTVGLADVEAYYRAQFVPKKMVVSVVGQFQPTNVQAAVTQWEHDLAAKTVPSKGTPTAAASPGPAPLALKESQVLRLAKPGGASQQQQAAASTPGALGATWIQQGWLAPPLGHPGLIPLKVLNSALGTGMSSRLFVNLREKGGLAYSVGSTYPSLRQPSRFVLQIGTAPKNLDAVTAGFRKEITRLQEEPIPAEELDAAKQKLVGQFALAHESNAQQAYFLGYYEALGVGYEYDQRYPEAALRVTPADVQAVAKSVFSRPSVTVIVAPDGKP
jgi:zinc protease